MILNLLDMNISMIAEQPRLLFGPALLLSHPHKSEDVNDDTKW